MTHPSPEGDKNEGYLEKRLKEEENERQMILQQQLVNQVIYSVLRIFIFTIILCVGLAVAKVVSTKLNMHNQIDDMKRELEDQAKLAELITAKIKNDLSVNNIKTNNHQKHNQHVNIFNPDLDELIKMQSSILDEKDLKTTTSRKKRNLNPTPGKNPNKYKFRNCPEHHFSINNSTCQKYLTCEQIKSLNFTRKNLIGQGMTKIAFLSMFQGIPVVVLKRNNKFKRYQDFEDNLKNLKFFQNFQSVSQVLGICEKSHTVILEYQEKGTLRDLMQATSWSMTSFEKRLDYAKSYLKLINLLHTQSQPRVNCDSNKLDGTTKQFLVTAEDELILSDLDDVPVVENGKKITCKHSEYLYARADILNQNFLAPEQLQISKSSPPKYDEKTDIYKIPDMVTHILTGGTYENPNEIAYDTNVVKPERKILEKSLNLLTQIKPILAKCRARNPSQRPSIDQILTYFNRL